MRPLDAAFFKTALPVRLALAPRTTNKPITVRRSYARPETHQNLIHPDKEHNHLTMDHGHRLLAPRLRGGNDNPCRTLTSLRRSNRNRSNQHPTHAQARFGGDDRDRTDDPLLAKQVLSQLSYAPTDRDQSNTIASVNPRAPIWWAREDLNLRPHAYQACALTS